MFKEKKMTHKTELEFLVDKRPNEIIDVLPQQLNHILENWAFLADAVEREMELGEENLVWKLILCMGRVRGDKFNCCEAKCELQNKEGGDISSFNRIRIFEFCMTDHIQEWEPSFFGHIIAEELSSAKK